MNRSTTNLVERRSSYGRFQIGPPQDREGVVQLFSLLLERADEQSALGKQFELPFAALLKLANCNRPSLHQLEQFCESHQPCDGWPYSVCAAAARSTDGVAPGMFFKLLRSALDTAKHFDVDGAHLCRALAAVGQTLLARNRRFRRMNRIVARKYRESALQRITPGATALEPAQAQRQVNLDLPCEVEFRRQNEQGGSLRQEGLTLWHASYIGPKIADKSENQDATFAAVAAVQASKPSVIFALADGVSTSMGSRVAANSIVRRFCEFVIQQMKSNEAVTVSDLIEAARRTQDSLDELATALLERTDGYIFDAVRGDSLHSKTAVRILEATQRAKASPIPAALSATLIAGIAQPIANGGSYAIELLRVGDGSVEHIRRDGEVCPVFETNPEVVAIAQALGPGPRSRAHFDGSGEMIETKSVTLQAGESLIVSSDGLVRGHQQSVSAKVSELMGQEFLNTAEPTQADAALQILHKACSFADELFKKDSQQLLFADNVSLILIRCGQS
ncbi:protein phosphatase 2C domain-containing protein [Acidicapsa acidisoli]|uniref:protein phosphatase 2C domain-containing protein n=1 Tax=Acidicapsa acidisoli TaxID=1615681 RepID=UPI0021E08486|nr:protein phosphatase 2C domain-containing protein [Acidicapsa acidisoli]